MLDAIFDELATSYEKHMQNNLYANYISATDIDHFAPARFFEFCVGIPYGTISANYTINSKYSYLKIEQYLVYARDELANEQLVEDVAGILFEDNKELFPELCEAYSVAIGTKNFMSFCVGITSGFNANDISWFLGASRDSIDALFKYLNQLNFDLINSVSQINSAKQQEDYQYNKYKIYQSILQESNDSRFVIQWFPSPKTCDKISKIYSDLDSESKIAEWFSAAGRLQCL